MPMVGGGVEESLAPLGHLTEPVGSGQPSQALCRRPVVIKWPATTATG